MNDKDLINRLVRARGDASNGCISLSHMEVLLSEVNKIIKEHEVVKVEPLAKGYVVYSQGGTGDASKLHLRDRAIKRYAVRPTEALAQKIKEMQDFMFFTERLKDLYDADFVADFENHNQHKFYPYYHHPAQEWKYEKLSYAENKGQTCYSTNNKDVLAALQEKYPNG